MQRFNQLFILAASIFAFGLMATGVITALAAWGA